MTKEELFKIEFNLPNNDVYNSVKNNWDCISKPLDGFGEFEELVCRIGAIKGTDIINSLKKSVVVMCSDNGIVEEGISQSNQSVTKSVAKMIGDGTSTICTLCSFFKAECIGVDVGINTSEIIPGLIISKTVNGTKNFLKEKAMSETDALKAIETGIQIVKKLKENGTDIIATGEMGIGNTTTASAVLCTLMKFNPEYIVGRGAGLDDAGLRKKVYVVNEAVKLYGLDKKESNQERALRILYSCGGTDIAGLTGLFIGGAVYSVPIVIDGFISSVAALVAEFISPGAKDFMIASHKGREKGTQEVLKLLHLKPYINGNMALGEGTGAAMMLQLTDMMVDFYSRASRFEDAKITKYERFEN